MSTSNTQTTHHPMMVLKSDVVIEPLVAQWHATTHLISPLTQALTAQHRHLNMLRSFLSHPEIHIAASQDPELLGGAFMNLSLEQTEAVCTLLDWTEQKLQKQCKLATDLRALWEKLTAHAHGQGLQHFYQELPDTLRGLIELVYTPAGAPDIRPIEALFYLSEFYDPSLQTALIYRSSGDRRSFAMSTPRFEDTNSILLSRPFADPVYDILARLRDEPMPRDSIFSVLNLSPEKARLFEQFIEPPPERQNKKNSAPTAQWRYFGHACVLVQNAAGSSVLVDPVIAYESGEHPARYTLTDLPDSIDYVIITHNHADHALIETLLAIRPRVKTILVPASGSSLLDPSLKMALQAMGFKDVREVNALDRVQGHGMDIQAIPFLGEHADLDIRCKAAWVVDTGNLKVMFAADSNNLDPYLYDRLKSQIGPLDALFLGMECQGAPMSWLYGPFLPYTPKHADDHSRRLDGSNAQRALQLVHSLGVKNVFIYAMGLEPWLKFICGLDGERDSPALQQTRLFTQQCEAQGISARRLYGKESSLDTETVSFVL